MQYAHRCYNSVLRADKYKAILVKDVCWKNALVPLLFGGLCTFYLHSYIVAVVVL